MGTTKYFCTQTATIPRPSISHEISTNKSPSQVTPAQKKENRKETSTCNELGTSHVVS